METETIILYLRIFPDLLDSSLSDVEKRLEGLGKVLFALDGGLNDFDEGDVSMQKIDMRSPQSAAVALYTFYVKDGSHATVKLHRDGLVNIDVQFSRLKKLQLESSKEYEDSILAAIGGSKVISDSNIMSAGIRRGSRVWPYTVTADHRLVEADWDQIICEVNSQYQNIKIVNSPTNGHVLLLDDDVMIAESDLIYTTVLCGVGTNQDIHREDFRDKEVLILGGGDGGILCELLKEKPKFVTMAEIDDDVIKVCKKHLRGVCYDALDQYDGVNHRIVLEDCVKVLKDFASRGKKVDFVINDLTEYPVEKSVHGHHYDFTTSNMILELSLEVLRPEGGKFLARGNCASASDFHARFEADVTALGLEFHARKVYVPSFMEEYLLYEVFRPKPPRNGH